MRKNIAARLVTPAIIVLAAVGFLIGSLAHMAGNSPHEAGQLSAGETRLLAQLALHPSSGGRYDVVMPDSLTVPLWSGNPGMPYDAKDFIVTGFRKAGEDISALVDRLYALNAKSLRLSLTPGPKDGYVVDDGTYAKYFQFGGGGWKALMAAHPQVRAVVRYSRPAYSEASGLFLIYVRTESAGAGSGEFHLYRDTGGTLKLLHTEKLWVR